jgi:hypothetical protein
VLLLLVEGATKATCLISLFSSILFAFDVLPGGVHLVLLLLVEGATKTACPIPFFDSLCFLSSILYGYDIN